jgi:regulatory protein
MRASRSNSDATVAQTWRMNERSYRRQPRAAAPLDAKALEATALRYLERFATTRARLRSYLLRKVRERGWDGDDTPPVDAVVERCAALGYVDDAAFAAARAGTLARRGFGARRVAADLRAVGISAEVATPLQEDARDGAVEAALRFARRRRIGPFAPAPHDPDAARRALAAMLRAGHELALARRIVAARTADEIAED